MAVRTLTPPVLLLRQAGGRPWRAALLAGCVLATVAAGVAWWLLMLDWALLDPAFEVASDDRYSPWHFFGKTIFLGADEERRLMTLGLLSLAGALGALAARRPPA